MLVSCCQYVFAMWGQCAAAYYLLIVNLFDPKEMREVVKALALDRTLGTV